MKRPALATASLTATLVLLAGCSGNAPQVQAPDTSASTTSAAPTGDAATATAKEAGSVPSSDAATSTEAPTDAGPNQGGVYLNPDATYAEAESDAELSILEQALLREPGPYAGEAFDARAVFDAMVATDPQSAREWSEAILTQIHPDYVQAAQEVISSGAPTGGGPEQPTQELRDVPVVGQNHFAIVLDAGASMAATSGGQTRMSQAKEAIRVFIGQLPQSSTVSFRVYGQRGSNADAERAASCTSTALLYNGPPDGMAATLDRVQPGGWAPLALAVSRSDDDIPPNTSDAIVYVVTDGTETCDGNPVEAAEDLAGRWLLPVVNVIGFGVDALDTPELVDMAQAGGGAYTAVDSQAELEAYWAADLQAMLEAWRVWQDEALTRIEEQESADPERAQDPGQAVMDASDLEWDQAMQLVRLMGRDGLVDYDTRLAVWEELRDRHITIWGWGYDETVEDLLDTYEQRVSSWAFAYDLGVDRWSIYYGKRAQGD